MKILIVKTSSLGDIIHAFPVLNFLHQEFPGVKVDWVVEKSFADIVRAHPLIDKVIEMDTKGWRKKICHPKTWQSIFQFRKDLKKDNYDVIFDLQGNTKSALPTFLAKSQNKVGFGLKTIHEWPNVLFTHHRFNPPLHLNVRDENLYLAQYFFERYAPVKNEKIILKLNAEQQKLQDEFWSKVKDFQGEKLLVCPGSAWKNKQLSYESLREFLTKVRENLNPLIFLAWGTAEEKELAKKLQEIIPERTIVLDKFPLPVLQSLMCKMDYVFAMDSLPLHLAGISGTSTFSVFGASAAQKYKPLGVFHHSMQKDCPYGKTFERRCPALRSCATGLCIRGLTGEEVYKEFFKWQKIVKKDFEST